MSLQGRCYSPAGSGSQLTVGTSSVASSTATLRSSAKDSKEKQNRQRLLAGPGSEFSLANPEDFELDYYDYNVINAGAAPGSYLGMDPAYLVWIPPLDGGDIIQEMDNDDGHHGGEGGGEYDAEASDDEEPHYEEIRVPVAGSSPPQSRSIHSIETASPSADVAPPMLPPLNGQQQQYARQMEQKNQRNSAISKVMAASVLSDESPSHGPLIPMKELRSPPVPQQANKAQCSGGGARIVTQPSEEEKETAVLKSPEPPRSMRSQLDDIQFADDVDDDEEEDSDDVDGDVEGIMLGNKIGGGAVVFVDNRSGTVRAKSAYYQAPTASTSYASGT